MDRRWVCWRPSATGTRPRWTTSAPPCDMLAARVEGDLLHQPRCIPDVGAVPEPPDGAAQAVVFHLIVRSARCGAALRDAPGVVRAALRVGERDGCLRAIRSCLERQ